MKDKKFRAIIFDWDGTLADSYKEGLRRLEIICIINEIPFNKDALTNIWGIPGEELIRIGLKVNEETAKKLYRQWELWDEYEDLPLIQNAKELIMGNHTIGIINGLLTSRRQPHKVLGRYGLIHFFPRWCVYGLDNMRHKKPNPRVFDEIEKDLDGCGIAKDEILFVGDTVVDAKCGIGAGIETVVVLTGGAKKDDLIREGIRSENILNSVADIPNRFHICNPFFL